MRVTAKTLAKQMKCSRWKAWRLLKRHFDAGTKSKSGIPVVRRGKDGRSLYSTTALLHYLLQHTDGIDTEAFERRLLDLEDWKAIAEPAVSLLAQLRSTVISQGRKIEALQAKLQSLST